METTDKQRAEWIVRADDAGRLARDLIKVLAENARLGESINSAAQTNVEERAIYMAEITQLRAGLAKARADERAELIECIQSTTWGDTAEEIVAMISARSTTDGN